MVARSAEKAVTIFRLRSVASLHEHGRAQRRNLLPFSTGLKSWNVQFIVCEKTSRFQTSDNLFCSRACSLSDPSETFLQSVDSMPPAL